MLPYSLFSSHAVAVLPFDLCVMYLYWLGKVAERCCAVLVFRYTGLFPVIGKVILFLMEGLFKYFSSIIVLAFAGGLFWSREESHWQQTKQKFITHYAKCKPQDNNPCSFIRSDSD